MIATVYDTKHAIAMTADNGAEILMHIGLDTVQLEGAWNVGIKDYKAHVTISSKRIHEAMDDTYYPKRHGFLRYAKTCFEHYREYAKIGSMITKLMTYPYTCATEDVAATQLTVGLRIALIELQDNGQLFVPFVPNDKQNIIQLLQEVPEEYPEITKKIVFYAENVLNTHLNPHIYLTLTDHLQLVGKIVKLVIYIMRYKPDKESIHYYIFKSIFPWQLCQNNRYKHERTSYQFSLA